MIANSLSGVQCQASPRPSWTKLTCQVGLLLFLPAILSTGCVSKEQYRSEKVRGLNFQRLLVQEEKRADTLDAKLAQKDKEITKLTAQLKETQDKIASLEAKNRDLTAALKTLKGESTHQPEQEPVADTPALSEDAGPSEDKPLSDPVLSNPFMSKEELFKRLGLQPK